MTIGLLNQIIPRLRFTPAQHGKEFPQYAMTGLHIAVAELSHSIRADVHRVFGIDTKQMSENKTGRSAVASAERVHGIVRQSESAMRNRAFDRHALVMHLTVVVSFAFVGFSTIGEGVSLRVYQRQARFHFGQFLFGEIVVLVCHSCASYR
jgi:hypothetical protein